MSIPTLEGFIEPLLRLLHERPEGVRPAEAYEEAANRVQLSAAERTELLESGQPVYQNRIGWAHDRLKRAGVSSSPQRGLWMITEAGRRFVTAHPGSFTLETILAEMTVVGAEIPDSTPTIGMLDAAHRTVVTVSRDTTVREAVTLMMLHNYSQLPVISGARTINGVVSWRSIGRRTLLQGPCEFVRECMDPDVKTVYEDVLLFDALPEINKHEFVLVQDRQGRITGIVTASDIGEQFREMSEPFILLGGIENHIRKLIARVFSRDDLRAARSPGDDQRQIGGIFDLNFAEYRTLLSSDENWKKLNLPVDKRRFLEALDSVRELRNDVMHFDPELDSQAVLELRAFLRFLREVAPISQPQAAHDAAGEKGKRKMKP
jgi:predicted transcriptional regulator